MRAPAIERVVPGARFVFGETGEITALARIPEERPILRVQISAGARCGWAADGFGALRRDGVSVVVRDDAVLVLSAAKQASLRLVPLFAPLYDEAARGRRLLLDEDGGFGAYPTRAGGTASSTGFSYELRPGDELWLSILPPRAPSPLRLSQSIAHEGRPRPFPDAAYPSTELIEDAARHCQVLALHAYFWSSGPRRLDLRAGRYALRRRPWTTPRHEPADPERFARVTEDCRRAGMKLVVYLSPRHCTAPDLFEEMERVLSEYGVDGLYLDGISDDFRTNDAVVRRTRAILGHERILYLNASDEPFGTPRVYCPFVDAQADFVLRGDSGRGGLPLARFLRFAVSGRGISNAVGHWCHYGSAGRVLPVERAPSARHVAAALANGVHLWRRSAWGAEALKDFDRRYYTASGLLR